VSEINAHAEQNGETYHSLDGYAQSMFANIMFAKGLAGRNKSISSFSVSPGSKYTIQSVSYAISRIQTPEQISKPLFHPNKSPPGYSPKNEVLSSP